MREIQLVWTDFKAFVDLAHPKMFHLKDETNPNKYFLFAATNNMASWCRIEDANDVSVFEASYLASSQAATSFEAGSALSVTSVRQQYIPTELSQMVYRYATLAPGNTNEQNILSYTVTTGKTFYLIKYSISIDDDNNKSARTWVQVGSGVIQSAVCRSSQDSIPLFFYPQYPIPFAESGNVVYFKVKANSSASGNKWAATLVGFEV